jgi:metal-sulfur cluster biosynthetic enzyme
LSAYSIQAGQHRNIGGNVSDELFTEPDVREALRSVIDPELGVNVVDLGLVYGIEIDGAKVLVRMTMTSQACPLSGYLRDLVDDAIRGRVRGVKQVDVELVWSPEWTPDMMSDEAREQLMGGEE